jgi:hypothetical protein
MEEEVETERPERLCQGSLAQRRTVRLSGDRALREVRHMVLRCSRRGRRVASVHAATVMRAARLRPTHDIFGL